MVLLLRKSPPNSMRGMRMVGPTARAISTEEAIQDIRYPGQDKSASGKE